MHWIDWAIVIGMLVGMVAIAWLSRTLTRSVSDFLAANRSAGRYLLTMASGMAGLGAISIAANFEKFYEAGFAGMWWGQMLLPITLILALSGFVTYRYRETRVMTMAQFFELRYGRRFRIFAGMLAFASGILNYGIFPAVTARFIVYFCGLPPELDLGFATIPTLAPVMLVLLGLALTLTLSGGQIAVMITDFFQGQFVNITMLVILVYLLATVGWDSLIAGLQQAPAEESKINPYKQADIPDFNWQFFVMLAFIRVYGFKAWQGTQGYNAAARSAHEAKMAGILAEFRGMITALLILVLPIFVYALLNLPEYAAVQDSTAATLATIENEQLQKQMRVPAALGEVLPIGIMGMFAAIIIAAAVSTDDTYLHSWGAIFIQDVVMPFRKKPLSKRTHLLLLRLSIFGVATFAFVFSLVFPLNEYIFMYFQITGAIFLGGAGSAILGGLYWKRGAAAGAWGAMIVGSILAVSGIVLRNIVWPNFLPGWKQNYPNAGWIQWLPDEFPLNGVEMAFVTALISMTVYVMLSLCSRRPPANMDKLLHRGEYAVADDHAGPLAKDLDGTTLWQTIQKRLGITAEFTRGDRWIYAFKITWTLGFFVVFAIGCVAAIFLDIPDWLWIDYWAVTLALTGGVGAIAVVWFLIGGFRDLFDLIHRLRTAERDDSDDGWVSRDDQV